mmetsp:Transcript_4684/g.13147  ORF Transcript_4684/g.13147 Transcript_4684/m.13147 type:complete len:228 (-) Transcript_4684:651-1334(-)
MKPPSRWGRSQAEPLCGCLSGQAGECGGEGEGGGRERQEGAQPPRVVGRHLDLLHREGVVHGADAAASAPARGAPALGGPQGAGREDPAPRRGRPERLLGVAAEERRQGLEAGSELLGELGRPGARVRAEYPHLGLRRLRDQGHEAVPDHVPQRAHADDEDLADGLREVEVIGPVRRPPVTDDRPHAPGPVRDAVGAVVPDVDYLHLALDHKPMPEHGTPQLGLDVV